jgi:hypothetical protein
MKTLNHAENIYMETSLEKIFVIYKAWIHRLCSDKSDGFHAMYEVLRLNTYAWDGLWPWIANVVARNDYRMSELIEESRLISPIRQLNKL